MIENKARLDGRAAIGLVQFDHIIQVLGYIDHQRLAHGLAALGGAAAARQDRHLFLGGNLDDADHVLFRARYDDTDGLDLVDRGVGAVAPPAKGIKQDRAFDLTLKTPGKA